MLYPIGIQNFEKIREGGYVYVDKTALVHRLVTTGKYYFLSRPRRFGKSLLVSTLETYFQGKRELFHGLAIENLEKDWNAYPVLHLDLSGVTYTEENVLDEKMENTLQCWEKTYGIDNTFRVDSIRFSNIIDAAYEKTGKPVVVLIDEYDKPLLDTAGNERLREAFRSRLQGFYSVMKSRDGKLRFGFLTGVTKLGKLSIRDEKPGRQAPLRLPDRCHQTGQAQHLQRAQQPQGHLDGPPLRGYLRYLGK